jgi:seryl-tRNA synthetase
MHDIRALRAEPERFDAAWARKGLAPQAHALLAADEAWRKLTAEKQELEAARNRASKEIGRAKASGDNTLFEKLRAEVEAAKARMAELDALEPDALRARDDLLAALPNLPAADVPEGADEAGNIEVRRWSTHADHGPPKLDLTADHVTLGEGLGLMDFEAAARMSGARFVVLKGALARLERALAAFMLDTHTGQNGYTEVNPPFLVKDQAMFGTGQLPKFSADLFAEKNGYVIKEDAVKFARNQITRLVAARNPGSESPRDGARHTYRNQSYWIREDATARYGLAAWRQRSRQISPAPEVSEAVVFDWLDRYGISRLRYLIPTAEVSLTNLVMDQIVEGLDAPLRLTAHTPCFRAEAGSAGRDVRGMIRQHQFSKVELVSICREDQSRDEHERMTACAEGILKALELPFRTMLLCAGDMGFSAQKTYDLEVWLPSQGKYREISSCSNCGDFQARRMSARYRAGEKDIRFVHTLNGSGLAVGRTLVAILENYQEPDGSVTIPRVLVPYMGGMTRIERTS